MPASRGPTIESHLADVTTIAPPEEFVQQAHVKDPGVREEAAEDPEAFWARFADELQWFRKWDRVLEWEPPHAKWFVGGTLNMSVNCVDRHVDSGRADHPAIVWEGEPGESRTLTFRELRDAVNRTANALKELGVKKGDRVAIYMPMVPELAIGMLACTRIGAVHSVVFAGFSAKSLATRIEDAGAKVVLTADAGYRRGKPLQTKRIVDDALAQASGVERVLVVKRANADVPMREGRDVWWHDVVDRQSATCAPEELDAEHPLFILYTSGTTGKPKGVLHTTGGYLVGTYATTKWVFDLKPDDVYFCTADAGWVTGHSYLVYGPLANGVTTVMYEGAPDWPEKDRFWDIVEKHRATVFYTAPTAIRAFMKWGEEHPARHDLSTLRLLGSVGEPINPEAWQWYHRVIGKERCPVVDTWWQTETGMIMITTLPGADTMRPGSAGKPFPGVDADIVNEEGNPVGANEHGGFLVINTPWPAMFRTLWQDDARYREEYWSRFPGRYFPKDGAVRSNGYYRILGRVDDILIVSGHNLSTMELESSLVNHPAVAEAAVVGRPDEMKGQAAIAFVILRGNAEERDDLEATLKKHVAQDLGPIARPDRIIVTPDLPKTRSGKIMRRVLRDLAQGRDPGDLTTLADPDVVDEIAKRVEN